eukprot:295977_1
MATKAVTDYENEIQRLKEQVASLQRSKIEQMKNTAYEIDRLRGYIKHITHHPPRNGFITNNIHDEMEVKLPISSSVVSPVTDNTSKDITSPEVDVTENVPLSPSPNKFSSSKPSRSNTDVGLRPQAEDMAAAMVLNHSIIVDMQQILDEFMRLQLFGVVECKCDEPKPLQFIATMDEPEMKCENCHDVYSSIFKCETCTMSICSTCQKYIAEMQCLRSVMQHFKYPKDYQRELEMTNSPRQRTISEHEYNDSIYSGFQYNYADQSHSVLDANLMKLENKLHFNASYRLEDIFEEELMYIVSGKATYSKMCYDILDYLDEVDWCCILQSKSSLQLFEIYWQLYQYHISYQNEWKKWKKLRVLFSTHWGDSELITIKERILKHNNVTKEYMSDYYIPTYNDNQLIKPKLLYEDEDEAYDNPQHTNYNVNEQNNRHFGDKVIRLLRIILDHEEYNSAKITFERLKHKQYGTHNDVLADGIFYIWHCHGLRRSFALEERLFPSFSDAIKDEEHEQDMYEEPQPPMDDYQTDAFNYSIGDNDPNNALTPMCADAPKFTYDTNSNDAQKPYHFHDDSSHSLDNSDDLGMMRFDSDENDF